MPRVRRRILHAARFSLATLLAVYVVGLSWEVFDIYVRDDVAEGLTAAATFAFNEQVWRVIALTEAAVVFLLRLGDLEAEPPSWLFAGALGLWLALASVATFYAIEEGYWAVAGVAVVVAAGGWLYARHFVPGRPGSRGLQTAVPVAEVAERDLR